ncbi:hypothetical protein P154DRAFT_257233 [Amniculicola lignicola CBS 123094]|uniref:Uncharacterized protein n=1 Tax=Amniculicola lignicola CBS 123094 TaxID=1392246 RepID=A0A6A5WYU2_9PLEO|nr:hypothetical protein P154DRAFT_257233 [Amniculicola lignicola CBS 123094]
MATPGPTTWTLRLKSYKTTVLLHVDPLSTFPTIKDSLLAVLRETGLRSEAHGDIPLPADPSSIQLGRPRNPNDPSQGFVLGEWEYQTDADEEAEGKGKAKAKIPGRGKQNAVAEVKDCPKGAGLRDGAVLAFRFREQGSGEDMDEEGEEADMWNVRIASFEDSYGVEEQGDVGGGREFEG